MRAGGAIIGAFALATAGPAWSQPLSRAELLQELRARDQAIAELKARVATLEKARGPATAAAPRIAAEAPAQISDGEIQPGVDVALQALSRTLVQRGGLVLPKWTVEVVPSIAYSHTLVQGLVLADTPEGIATVADQRLREDSLRGSVALRMGLPWSSQAEVRVPYGWVRQDRALGDGSRATHNGSGLGDVEISLSHQAFRERGWRPDLVAGLAWRFPTGRDPLRTRIPAVATGTGTRRLTARVTAVKSSDPMVFFTTLSYGRNFEQSEAFGRYKRGDEVDWDLGTVLAVSPETSLTLGLAQQFRGLSEIDGTTIHGSDGVSAALFLGVDRVITPRVLVDFSLGVGLTRDSPDYVFQISTPVRF